MHNRSGAGQASRRVLLIAGAAVAASCLQVAPALAAGDPNAGAALFANRCAACHALHPTRKPGPLLSGVYGRRAGTVPGYQYSMALKRSGVIWNDATLDRWLAGPPAYIPGVNMQAQVDTSTDRLNLIAYLKSTSPSRPRRG